VWLDYFAVALVPLAIVRPRLSLVWFLPLATWGVEGAGIGIGDAAGSARVLLVFLVVFGLAFADERRQQDTLDGAPRSAEPASREGISAAGAPT
jgi:hypothetical protein